VEGDGKERERMRTAGAAAVFLVVPTGFEPVSHLESVLELDFDTCEDARI
jgi:hypothetical protein